MRNEMFCDIFNDKSLLEKFKFTTHLPVCIKFNSITIKVLQEFFVECNLLHR